MHVRDFKQRVVLAFAIAPISVPLFVLLPIGIALAGNAGEWIWFVVLFALVGYPVAILIGLPLFLMFRRLGWNGLPVYMTASLFPAALLIAGFIVFPASRDSTEPLFEQFQSGTRLAQVGFVLICSAITVLAFWLMARPDRYTK